MCLCKYVYGLCILLMPVHATDYVSANDHALHAAGTYTFPNASTRESLPQINAHAHADCNCNTIIYTHTHMYTYTYIHTRRHLHQQELRLPRQLRYVMSIHPFKLSLTDLRKLKKTIDYHITCMYMHVCECVCMYIYIYIYIYIMHVCVWFPCIWCLASWYCSRHMPKRMNIVLC